MQSIQNKTKYIWVALTAAALGGALYLYTRSPKSVTTSILSKKKGTKSNSIQIDQDLAQNRYLSKILAERRANQVVKGSVAYNVDLFLKKGDSYEGLVRIEFKVSHVSEDLFLDYRGEQINGLRINGKKQSVIQWNKLFIIIPKEALLLGEANEIQLKFKNKYSSDGTGLHSYFDTDGKQYLYSQGESYFCNRFFPCIDQPDIKGILKFKLVAPKEWTVISNENVEVNQPFDFITFKGLIMQQYDLWVVEIFAEAKSNEYNIWTFGTTPLLPSYLYCIVAGEYWSIKSELPGVSQTIYCRESLKEHMLKIKDFLFEVTLESLKFYESFFGVKFPFSKYDSLFVAEFNFGAMEHPGCVTFNDNYVFREQQVSSKYTQLANTIAHEMAHMWFGNYVTMKWWNDLWLNESYADFISHYCLQQLNIKSIPLTNIGVLFNTRKGWGYREDQMITTHPIAGDVPNTETAETIFDGITYSKGASVMKQLLCIMGPQAFGKACGAHFQRFAWDNATLQDLINSLNVEFVKQKQIFTLESWQKEWIQTAGMNEVLPEWDIIDTSVRAVLKIHQTAALSEFPTLRKHKMKVAFFKVDGSIISKDIMVLDQAVTSIEYDGSKQYRAVLLNYEDETFVKVLLDETSLAYFGENLHLIKDALTRQIIWRSFFDVVRDGKISSEEYVDLLIKNLPREEADEILATQMLYLESAVHTMTPRIFKKPLATRVFHFIVEQLKQLVKLDPKNQNRLIQFRDSLFSYVLEDSLIEKLTKWRDEQDSDLKDVPLSNQSQWNIIELIHSSKKYDIQLKNNLLGEQSKKDQSDLTKRMEKRCYALAATPDQLRSLWASYLDPLNKESAKLQVQSMIGFNNSRRFEELQEFQDKYFDVLIDVFENRTTDFAKQFYAYLFPITDDLAFLNKRLNDALVNAPASQVTLRLDLAKSLDGLKKKVKQFETFGKRSKLAHLPLQK